MPPCLAFSLGPGGYTLVLSTMVARKLLQDSSNSPRLRQPWRVVLGLHLPIGRRGGKTSEGDCASETQAVSLRGQSHQYAECHPWQFHSLRSSRLIIRWATTVHLFQSLQSIHSPGVKPSRRVQAPESLLASLTLRTKLRKRTVLGLILPEVHLASRT